MAESMRGAAARPSGPAQTPLVSNPFPRRLHFSRRATGAETRAVHPPRRRRARATSHRRAVACNPARGREAPPGSRGGRGRPQATPPAFAKAPESENGRAVDHTFWLTPGHATESGTWYAGTSPHGLFRSDDGGVTWQPVSGLNDDPRYRAWRGGPQDGTPTDRSCIRSSSTRGIRRTCSWAPRAGAFTSRATPGRRGHLW